MSRGGKALAEGGTVDLLSSVLRGTPRLDGALCVGRWELFDAPNASAVDVDRAIGICQRCTALEPCRIWAEGQRRGCLTGVVGGKRYYLHRHDDEDGEMTKTEGQHND